MSIVGPSSAELAEIAADLGFHFDAADVAAFRGADAVALDAYSALDRLPDALPVPRHPRLPGSAPSAEDNPFGAFARTVEITGEPNGPLAGKRVVIKDCVVRRRRADDERLVDFRGVRSRKSTPR